MITYKTVLLMEATLFAGTGQALVAPQKLAKTESARTASVVPAVFPRIIRS